MTGDERQSRSSRRMKELISGDTPQNADDIETLLYF